MTCASPSLDFSDIERLLIAFNSALALLLFPAFGVYETWRGKPLAMMLARVTLAWMAVVAAGLLLAFTLHRMDAVSRLWFGYSTLISGALIIASKLRGVFEPAPDARTRLQSAHGGDRRRAGFRAHVARASGQHARAGLHARLCARHDRRHELQAPAPRREPSDDAVGTGGTRLPVLNDFDELVEKVRAEEINEVWLALPLSQEHTIYRFVHALRHDFVNLRLIPDTRSISLFNHSMTDVAGLATINLTTSPVGTLQMWPKLLFDRLLRRDRAARAFAAADRDCDRREGDVEGSGVLHADIARARTDGRSASTSSVRWRVHRENTGTSRRRRATIRA